MISQSINTMKSFEYNNVIDFNLYLEKKSHLGRSVDSMQN